MNLKSTIAIIAVLALIPGAVFTVAGEGDAKAVISPSLENGDVNGDERRDITDVIHLVNFLFVGGPPPVTAYCEVPATGSSPARLVDTVVANGDVNNSGRIDITDVIGLVNWLYSGGPAPAHMGCNWLDLD